MRIALTSQSYPPHGGGGIATQTRLKARGLADLGHDVVVIAHGEDRREESADGGARVVRIAAPRPVSPGGEAGPLAGEAARWVAYSAAVAVEIARLDAEDPLDLVEFPEWGAEGFCHLIGRGPEPRLAAVVQLHGPLVMLARALGWPPPESELYRVGRILEGTSLRLADAVYSSSACSIEWCAREHGLDTSGWPVLHAGVDTAAFAPGPAERDDRPTVLFVGKIVPNKGALLLVEACARLAERIPGLRLRLLGGGEPEWVRAVEARAATSPGLLELAGFVPRERLPDELRRADVFAAPSVYEGGPGFVYLEAMACGLPVVACAGSGVEEAVAEDCGILVPPDDVDALAAALDRLLGDPSLRRRMGERGRERALEVDTRRCVPRIEAFYRRVVRGATTKAGAC